MAAKRGNLLVGCKPKKKRRKKANLKPEHLVKFLNSLFLKSEVHRGTRLKVEQIKKPTKDVVRKIYEVLTSEILGINPNVFLGSHEGDAMPNHEESRKEVALFFNTKRMLTKLRQHDFDLHDIHDPQWNKLKYHLCEAVNFLNFRAQLRKKAESTIQERNLRQSNMEKLQSEQKQIKLDRDACLEEIAQDKKRIVSLPQCLEQERALNLRVSTCKKTVTDLQTDLVPRVASVNNMQCDTERMESRLKRLETSVAEDPEKIKQEVTRLEAENERGSLSLKQGKEKHECLRKAKKTDAEVSDYLKSCIFSFRRVRRMRASEEMAKKDFDEIRKIQGTMNREKNSITKRTSQLHKKEAQERDNNATIRSEHTKERQRLQDKKTKAETLERKFQMTLENHRKSIQDQNRQIEAIKREMQTLQPEWDAYDAEIQNICRQFQMERQKYVQVVKHVRETQNWSAF